jgi:hypothetical protein
LKINVAPRILSAEEKRELILAHAAARRPVDPVQRMSLWAGVAICLVFVVGAWVYSVGSGIKKSFAQGVDPGLSRSAELTKDFLKNPSQNGFQATNELGQQMKAVTDRLNELETQDQIIQAMAAEIATSTATASSTPNLFKPSTKPSTSSNATTTLTP